ncbi:MAG TPA: hypothetical protein VFW96_27240 [Thermomicrobiales bacterium]|nr:hypothetical protein [Thermomicrobiales bacterium]
MYATIQRHAAGGAPSDDCVRAGRALGAHLGELPGFVAYVLVEEPGGGYTAVSIFEDRAGVEDAERLVAAWLAAHPGVPWPDPARLAAGEVVVQKGL